VLEEGSPFGSSVNRDTVWREGDNCHAGLGVVTDGVEHGRVSCIGSRSCEVVDGVVRSAVEMCPLPSQKCVMMEPLTQVLVQLHS
jgi:hypothetical protein